MSDEYHVAYPKLFGAPAYARPPRPALPENRPLDPDDLPLEAHRTPEEQSLISSGGALPDEPAQSPHEAAPDRGLVGSALRALGIDR